MKSEGRERERERERAETMRAARLTRGAEVTAEQVVVTDGDTCDVAESGDCDCVITSTDDDGNNRRCVGRSDDFASVTQTSSPSHQQYTLNCN